MTGAELKCDLSFYMHKYEVCSKVNATRWDLSLNYLNLNLQLALIHQHNLLLKKKNPVQSRDEYLQLKYLSFLNCDKTLGSELLMDRIFVFLSYSHSNATRMVTDEKKYSYKTFSLPVYFLSRASIFSLLQSVMGQLFPKTHSLP